MAELLTTKKQSLKSKRRKEFIDRREPIGHPVVIGVLGLGQKFLNLPMHPVGYSISGVSDAAIGRDTAQRGIAFRNKAQ